MTLNTDLEDIIRGMFGVSYRGRGGGDGGTEYRDPHMRRALYTDTRMNSCGFREGPIEDAHVQGPEFCATLLPNYIQNI